MYNKRVLSQKMRIFIDDDDGHSLIARVTLTR